jgi:hypothetical protein
MPLFTHAGFAPYSVKDFRVLPHYTMQEIMMSIRIIENRAGLKAMEYSGMKCMPFLKLFILPEMPIRKPTQYGAYQKL